MWLHYGDVIMRVIKVSNNQPHGCLLNGLLRRKNIKAPRHWPL